MFHGQDCCEEVWLEDIIGDLDDLVGSPILKAEKRTDENLPPVENSDFSYTWTFYEFATIKGSVTLRWFGTSNGYYSEDVDVEEKYYGITKVNKQALKITNCNSCVHFKKLWELSDRTFVKDRCIAICMYHSMITGFAPIILDGDYDQSETIKVPESCPLLDKGV